MTSQKHCDCCGKSLTGRAVYTTADRDLTICGGCRSWRPYGDQTPSTRVREAAAPAAPAPEAVYEAERGRTRTDADYRAALDLLSLREKAYEVADALACSGTHRDDAERRARWAASYAASVALEAAALELARAGAAMRAAARQAR